MIEKISAFLKSKKGGRVLVIAGVIGMVLIYASTFSVGKEKNAEAAEEEFSEEDYTAHLEQQVREIVAAVSGDTSAVVTVTLDSGPTYVYAEDKRLQSSSEEGEKSEDSESSYIIVRDENGAEKPLVVTRRLPAVRGVAIVCGPVGEDTKEKIQSAVMAALDVTGRKIYIANRTR